MSARVELHVRGALARLGTAPVSIALLALAVVYVVFAEVWSRHGGPASSRAVAGSAAYWGLAAVMLADSAVATIRALRRAGGGPGARARPRAAVSRACLAIAWLLASVAFVAHLAGRDRLVLRLAEGEEYSPAGEQIVGRDPPRPLSAGPLGERFTVEEIRLVGGGAVEDVSLVAAGGATRRASARSPAWFPWARFLRPLRAGRAVRYEVAAAGAVREDAFVKLDAGPRGATGTIKLGAFPYRVLVREAPAPSWRQPRLAAIVYRGSLPVAEGGTDAPLRFEGISFDLPEWRPWVELELLTDPGIPLALAAAALALAGLVAWAGARRAGSPRGTTAPRPPVPRSAP